jgi:hypothetical protein
MILSYLQRIHINVVLGGYLVENLSHTTLDVTPQHPLAILRSPHEMIFGIIDCMTRPFYRHGFSLAWASQPFKFTSLGTDSSPVTGRGFLRFSL